MSPLEPAEDEEEDEVGDGVGVGVGAGVVGAAVGVGAGVVEARPDVHVTELPSADRTHFIVEPVLVSVPAPAGASLSALLGWGTGVTVSTGGAELVPGWSTGALDFVVRVVVAARLPDPVVVFLTCCT